MAKKKNIKPHYRPVSYEEVYAAAKEIFGDTEKFWNSLHPSVQRLVHDILIPEKELLETEKFAQESYKKSQELYERYNSNKPISNSDNH